MKEANLTLGRDCRGRAWFCRHWGGS